MPSTLLQKRPLTQPSPPMGIRGEGFVSLFFHLVAEPAAAESGALQALANIRILAHGFPDEAAAVVFNHEQDRPLIDAQIQAVEPTLVRYDTTGAQRTVGEGEARIERVDEAVLSIQIIAV